MSYKINIEDKNFKMPYRNFIESINPIDPNDPIFLNYMQKQIFKYNAHFLLLPNDIKPTEFYLVFETEEDAAIFKLKFS